MIEKIVTTDPTSTEIVYYLDGLKRLKGVSDKCTYPPEVISLPKVVKTVLPITDSLSSREIDEVVREFISKRKVTYELDQEVLEEISPDLIVGQALCSVCAYAMQTPIIWKKVKSPKKIKVPTVYQHNPLSFISIAESIYKLSKVISRQEKGERTLMEFRELERKIMGKGRSRKIAFIEWLDPIHYGGLWVSDLIKLSGSVPMNEGFGRRGDFVELKEFNPDIIIISPCGFSINRTMRELNALTWRSGWKELKAVKRGEVYVVDSRFTASPSYNVSKFAEFLIDVLDGVEVKGDVGIKVT
jgi:ABC-type Fe3+-hydroxamate transport system, periplasmic component